MSEEVAELKRDSTMAVTAKEGKEFLEGKGKVDEDAKTRLQQKEIEDVTEPESTSDKLPKVERTTTMAETAKEGEELLDGAELGKTRGETAKQDDQTNEDKKPVQRTTTMEATSEEARQLLEKEGGLVEGTRSEAKQLEEVTQKSAEKQTNGVEDGEDEIAKLKRKGTMAVTAEEGEEFLKRQKVEESDEAIAAKEIEA